MSDARRPLHVRILRALYLSPWSAIRACVCVCVCVCYVCALCIITVNVFTSCHAARLGLQSSAGQMNGRHSSGCFGKGAKEEPVNCWPSFCEDDWHNEYTFCYEEQGCI